MPRLTDAFHAWRSVRSAPSHSLAVALTLALGIGATTAVFTVVDALLLTPLPYADADRLVALWQRAPDSKVGLDWLSPGQYSEIREQSTSFEELALFYGGPLLLNLHEPAEEVGFLVARSPFFRVLGATPQLGRLLVDGDDAAEAPVVAVITHELWQRRYGGDPNIVGRTVGLDFYPFEVVGVLEPGFPLDGEVFPVGGGMNRYDIVLSMPRTEEQMSDWENEGRNIIGKLGAGVSEVQAQSEMDVISARLRDLGLQQIQGKNVFVDVVPFLDQVVGRVRTGLWMLFAAAGLLLLIGCMNVVNLHLVRGASRKRELGICAAMGAGRDRIAARLLMESLLLAAFGGVLGVGVAWTGVSALAHLGPVELPRLDTMRVDEATLWFALAVMLTTTVISGLVPARRLANVDVRELIQGGGRTRGVLPKRPGTSTVLVVAQIATAFALLTGAGLLVRSFARLLDVDPGFTPEGRLAIRVQEPIAPDRPAEEARAVAVELFRQVRALPGVRAVATATPFPFGQGSVWGPIQVDGYVPRTDEPPVISDLRFVSPGYFGTMGVRLVSGRVFTEDDVVPGAPPVRIVDRPFAEHFWPDQDPLGRFIGEDDARFPEYRRGMVVGVVEHVRHYALETDGRVTAYLPDGAINRTYLIVHSDGDPRRLIRPLMETVEAVNSQIVVTDIRTMDERLADARAERRFALLLMQSFALMALVLAAIGLYGVISHGVLIGSPELGVRMALGASERAIIRFVLRFGLTMAASGLVVGVGISFLSQRGIESLLYRVSAVDAPTYVGVALLLGAVCVVACWIPARRASRMNPLDVLRE